MRANSQIVLTFLGQNTGAEYKNQIDLNHLVDLERA
jgi:hypothetical protein